LELSDSFFGPTTCAFDHSCISNATLNGYTLDDDPSKILVPVIAMKSIDAGTEITIP
jgi:hypothetical protein